MSRVLFLSLAEGEAVAQCLAHKVGISAIERLPGGGVRLVCTSSEGSTIMGRKLKRYIMDGETERQPHRPRTPHW
jgi:hypothetical protein